MKTDTPNIKPIQAAKLSDNGLHADSNTDTEAMTSTSPNMNNTEAFADHLKQQLDAEQDELSPGIAKKLQQVRNQAMLQAQLDKGSSSSTFSHGLNWLREKYFDALSPSPWLAACASTLAVVVFLAFTQVKPAGDNAFAQLDAESELLFADENLDLYQDLEFYHWLANTGY